MELNPVHRQVQADITNTDEPCLSDYPQKLNACQVQLKNNSADFFMNFIKIYKMVDNYVPCGHSTYIDSVHALTIATTILYNVYSRL